MMALIIYFAICFPVVLALAIAANKLGGIVGFFLGSLATFFCSFVHLVLK